MEEVEKGNRPIPKQPKVEAVEIPKDLGQPEKQGNCIGGATSAEGIDNVGWAATVTNDSSYEMAEGEVEKRSSDEGMPAGRIAGGCRRT